MWALIDPPDRDIQFQVILRLELILSLSLLLCNYAQLYNALVNTHERAFQNTFIATVLLVLEVFVKD